MSGGIAVSGLTDNDATARHTVLDMYYGPGGKEYIYLKGVASTVAGNLVTFDETGVTTRLAANAVGRVAVAMAATVANEFGWYQTKGVHDAVSVDTSSAADVAMYIGGTAASADSNAVAGDFIDGLVQRGAESGGFAQCELNNPQVYNIAPA